MVASLEISTEPLNHCLPRMTEVEAEMNSLLSANPMFPSSPPLVGRDQELDVLRHLLREAAEGRGGLALVSGEAGIGKTSLTDALVSQESGDGFFLLRGYCYDLSTTPPYGLWVDLADRYRPSDGFPEIPDVLRVGTGAAGLPNQLAVFEVVRDFFLDVAEAQPAIVVLEDLHWADQASLDLLRYVSRYLQDSRLLVIGTYRDDELNRHHPLFTLIPVLIREAQAKRIELGTLRRDDIQRMVSERWALSSADQSRLTEHLLVYAEGNPFFTVEILRTLEQNGALHAGAEGWRLADLRDVPMPPLVQQVIEGRLARIDEENRHFLEIAAVIGQEVDIEVWRQVSGLTDAELLGVIEQAVEQHVLEQSPDGNRVRFVHALTRETLYRGILSPRRRVWHRMIAEAFEQSELPVPDSIAYHYQQAQDRRAVDWLIRAGEWAQETFAWRNAVDRFRAASVLLESDEAQLRQRAWLLYRIGRLSLYLDPAAGAADLDAANRIASQIGDRVLYAASLVRRGHLITFTGDLPRGVEDMGAGVAAWDNLTQEEKQSCEFFDVVGCDLEVNVFRGTWLLMAGNCGLINECLEVGERFLAEVEPVRDRLLRERHIYWLDGYVGIADAQAAVGNWRRARELLEFAQRGFAQIGIPIMESYSAHAILRRVHIAYETERLDDRRRLLSEFDDAWNRSSGSIRPEMSRRLQHIQVLALEGHWDDVLELAEHGMEWHANKIRQVELRACAGHVARHRGDTDLAWSQVKAQFPDGTDLEPGKHVFTTDTVALMELAAELAIDAGDVELVRHWLEYLQRWLDSSSVVLGRAKGELIRARLAVLEKNHEAAKVHADEAFRLASDPRQPLALLAAHRMLGELALASGDYDESERQLTVSSEIASRCGTPFERALSDLSLAELRLVRGEADRARELAREVRDVFDALGAEPSRQRADRVLSRLGHHVNVAGSGLTAREAEVLKCLVDGMPDKAIADQLFISRHTVMRHVSSILRKLDVDSRTAAATRAVRDSLV